MSARLLALRSSIRSEEVVDPGRIGLPPQQCECRVIPLYYGPFTPEANSLEVQKAEEELIDGVVVAVNKIKPQ
jgi:hypothetical protein